MTADLVARARTGDGDAFGRLIEPHRRELTLHCYRILGSMHDAEDALQDTLLAAWQGLGSFEERWSVRTWLYQIATTRSLNAARSRGRHRGPTLASAPGELPEPNGRCEVTWLEPFPESMLERIADQVPGPDARYEVYEAVSLAFVTALQVLTPRPRAVLILRDVLGFHTEEVARMLGTTEDSVASALKRARAALQRGISPDERESVPSPRSRQEGELVERFTRAFEAADVDAVVALLTDDIRFAMPPLPFEWRGREAAGRFLAAMWAPLAGPPRLLPIRASGQPSVAIYGPAEPGDYRFLGLLVLTLAAGGIRVITRFEPASLHHFDLPSHLPPQTPVSHGRGAIEG